MDSTLTEHIDVAVPRGDGPYRLELSMGAGTLQLQPGAVGKIIQGTITYNVEDLKPIVTMSGSTIRIEQDRFSARHVRGDLRNDWNLELGDAPMALKLAVGAAKGKSELGGLSLTELTIAQGASDFTVVFSRLNNVPLEKIVFDAGAARSVIEGLANANAQSMQFRGGAGDFRLDFGGTLQRDLSVDVTAAAGNLVIVVPEGVASSASLNGVLTHVTTKGSWHRAAGSYVLLGNGPAITFDLKMSVGKLELRTI